jgi:hypothetical protein
MNHRTILCGMRSGVVDTVVVATVAATTRRQNDLRAQAARLEARGYSVK